MDATASLMVEAIAAPVIVLAADGQIVAWNGAHTALVGARAAGARHVRELVSDPAALLAHVQQAAAGAIAPATSVDWLRDDGARVTTSTVFRVVPGGAGVAAWVVGTSQRVTAPDALGAFFQAAPMGVITRMNDGRIAFNARAEQILGMALTRDGGVEQYVTRLRHLDGTPMRAEELPSVRALHEQTRIAAAALRVARPDGTGSIILQSAAPIFDLDQRVIGSMVILEDISSRLHDEMMIASSIVALAHDAIIAIDAAHRIVLFNAGAEATFGWTVADVIGRPLNTLLPARFHAQHDAHLDAFAATEGSARRMAHSRGTVTGLRRDGTEFPIEASIAKIDLDRRPLLAVVLRDATEQRQRAAEQEFLANASTALVSSLEYEQTLTTVARLAVPAFADACIVNIVLGEGEARRVRRLKVAHVDPAFHARLSAVESWPAREVENQPIWRDLFAGRSVLISDLAAGPLPIPIENPEHAAILKALGALSLIVVPMVARERVLGTVSFITSTSGRRYDRSHLQLAEELARRAALALDNAHLYAGAQQAIRARDEVLAIVAHDLRNPLNAISLTARTVASAQRRAGLDPAAAGRIVQSAERAGRMLGELLDVAKIDAGAFQVAPVTCAASELVDDAMRSLGPLADEAGVELGTAVGPGAASVLADRDRVAQVFSNLIGNALKFTPSGGRITIGTAVAGSFLAISVTDTGPGIPAEQIPHLFDRFWQGHSADRRGAGLGLAIVEGIVKAHHGTVSVASEVGSGTTITFTLPLAPA